MTSNDHSNDHALFNSVISNDREWLSKIANDMERRAGSLQLLSFLSILTAITDITEPYQTSF